MRADQLGPNRFLRWLNRLICHSWHRLPRSYFDLPEGAVILVGNHLCGLDPLLLQASVKRPVCFLMSRDYYRSMWYLRRGFDWVGAIPVSPGGANKNALKSAMDALNNSNVLCLFPEGAANPDVPLQRILPGAALLARETGSPVIPFYVSGVMPFDHEHMWPPFIHRSHARVVFGEPIAFKDSESWGRAEIAKDCQQIGEAISSLKYQ